MKIHLVTYATPRFRLRQLILGWSARVNRVVNTVTHWTPNKLLATGFEERCKGIKLNERGSGFWAWKPFIIEAKLREVPDGDIVFYCDVGRRYPFKILERPITPYLEWMQKEDQAVMPGVHIPWKGSMSMWTKRAAFRALDLDMESAHRSIPIQASFSVWVANPQSRKLCVEWLDLCSQVILINDSPSPTPLEELPDFFEHRHDQSLLSLVCLKNDIHGIHIGDSMPLIDTQHPDEILGFMGHELNSGTFSGRAISLYARMLGAAERAVRNRVKFGQDRQEPDFQAKSSSNTL